MSTDVDGDPPEVERPHRGKGKDTLLIEAKDRQIAAAEARATKAEEGKDEAQDETVEAWKWSSNAWRNTFLGSWAIAGILVSFVLGVNYLDLNVPLIGHLKLSRDATSAGEKAAEASNATDEAVEMVEEEP